MEFIEIFRIIYIASTPEFSVGASVLPKNAHVITTHIIFGGPAVVSYRRVPLTKCLGAGSVII